MSNPAGKSRSVAVIIPAFNAQQTIAAAVRSALREPEAREVVVVDDGSDDDSAKLAAGCDDGSGRLRVIRQANRGPSAAFNRGVEASRADYVCRLDADDLFWPGRFEAIFALASGAWDFAADKLLVTHELDGAGPCRPWVGEGVTGRLSFAAFVSGNIGDPRHARTELGFLKPLVSRAFLERTGLRQNEQVRYGEDFLFYAGALALGARFEIVDHFGYVALAHQGSLSFRHTAEDLRRLLAAERQLAQQPLASPDRRALARHVRHVQDKLQYRLALEAKQRGDLLGVARLAAGDPHALGHMIAQTLRARLDRACASPQ
ncbi:MAG: glycosyltransferase [Caulobacteraceae bacterium]|nr:glycosyltransferase [Caulobacteraceae bacterium]